MPAALPRPLVLCLLLGALALAGCSASSTATGQSVQPFQVPLLDGGGAVGSRELGGKVVVVNFFASWCVPCREEAPDLQQSCQQYRDKGVSFLGVDMKDDDAALARQFVRELGIAYPSGQDADGRMAEDFKVVGLPNTFILGKDGRIAHRFIGPVKRERLAELLDTALAAG
jgi:cytochrome c biogenesis protein CcmG/thiol:disulfide interchange protein DsbE